ncbi:MAG: helix-turn-helix domain-containing protein, partial [Lutimonas sp.]
DALPVLLNYSWNGNIRQLKNIVEQISVIEQNRSISKEILKSYLPDYQSNLPAIIKKSSLDSDFSNEREILYKVLFDMRNDINDLKKLTQSLMKEDGKLKNTESNQYLINKIYGKDYEDVEDDLEIIRPQVSETYTKSPNINSYDDIETIDESVSLQEKEYEMIKKSLDRNKGKRKLAAKELGISERTLYRKIKQYDL